MNVSINVLGIPGAKGSPRPVIRGGRAFLTPSHSKSGQKKLMDWNGAVRSQALIALGVRTDIVFVNKPLAVELHFRLTRPNGHRSKKTGELLPSAPIAPATKPDADKLARSTLDSLTGLVFDDDSRIVQLIVTKSYAGPGQEGAYIEVHEYNEEVSVTFTTRDNVEEEGSEGDVR